MGWDDSEEDKRENEEKAYSEDHLNLDRCGEDRRLIILIGCAFIKQNLNIKC